MLKIHQPYKYKRKYIVTLCSIGALLLGGLWFCSRLWELSSPTNYPSLVSPASAAGDDRTMADITEMQEMTQQICSNSEVGDTATLKDNRDGNTYAVVKLKDGNCWMQQNLRLGKTTAMTLKPSDTDITSNWTLPAATTSWNDGGNAIAQTKIGSTSLSSSWQVSWGNYYSWCAATAGTCSETTSDNNVNVSGSICPKGWHLPSGGNTSVTTGGVGTDSEFYKLTNGLNMSTITALPYMFSAAGDIQSSDGLHGASSIGLYWSRTSGDGSRAYYLAFGSSHFGSGTYLNLRYHGSSVRCLAPGGLNKIEKPVFTDTKDEGINVTVPKVITLDVSDGINTTADAYKVVTGEIVATVTSNNIDYQVLLSSEQPSLVGQKDATNSISPVSASNPVKAGNNAWGILNAASLYDPITITPKEYYNTATSNGTSTSHTYGVGISISPTLPADTYKTTVTVTASSK